MVLYLRGNGVLKAVRPASVIRWRFPAFTSGLRSIQPVCKRVASNISPMGINLRSGIQSPAAEFAELLADDR
jgi:hypothetical protein